MKLGIIGTGMVGSAAAYAIACTGVVSSLVLIDHNPELASAQAADIADALPFIGAVSVQAGDYADLDGASIVVIAAGVAQKSGESRLQLLGRNADIFADVIAKVLAVAPDAILLVATNPVDIMTAVTTRLSGLDPARVIGTGTILDTARFRKNLSRHLGVSPQSVHAHVLGEHGDSEVLIWSSAECGAMQLESFARQRGCPLTDVLRAQVEASVRQAAQVIIAGKGATWFGIGAGLARIVRVIALNQHEVLTVSSMTDDVAGVQDVCLSLPRIIGAGGIEDTLMPAMTETEMQALGASARMLKETTDALGEVGGV
ncbi:L-lactate dehydrogenase [Granulosicoccus antarcticus]|uniref:L-lactate dehydrogenase n=1 Tax=Granulosicoccus antarcticus IMCC3135 TaxID=1192854 RepID=A0A2Z2P6L5_9GAMM|nr:L-lactate dehydrogenase [Granulosicoccus antarcticus]ASJ76337.1 L-lactate dehydrogenase [Granulosicoccus antarcticus IMCC3135]